MREAVFSRSIALPGGSRVRLRLARTGDARAVTELLGRGGVAAQPLEVRRLLSYHPASRIVLCALAPLGGAETLVGLGAIDLDATAEVDTLVTDDAAAPGLSRLLGEVLVQRSRAHARRAA